MTLTNKLPALPIIQVVVREHQIKATRCERAPCRSETGNNGNAVLFQELTRDLLCEDCVVLKVEDVHGSVGLRAASGAPDT